MYYCFSKSAYHVVMMSYAGIQESHNFITIQTGGLKAISERIVAKAYAHQVSILIHWT
jgi:hypothetical protein